MGSKERMDTEETDMAEDVTDDDHNAGEVSRTGAEGNEEEENEDDNDEDEENEDEDIPGNHDNEDNDEDNENDVKGQTDFGVESKKKKLSITKKGVLPGIVYLGHIPPRLRPKHMRNMLSVYGEIGRVFLQPEDRSVKRKKKKAGSKACSFIEGWVEFRDKRLAKRVAASLHNTPMGARKRNRFSSDLWCIKYLHRFQWCHLSERLAYEQTVLQQRLRTEISQAKRETNFYLANVEKSQNLAKLRKKRARKGEKEVEEKTYDFTQRRTEEEIQLSRLRRQTRPDKAVSGKSLKLAQDKAKVHQEKAQSNVSLLAKIFNSSKN